MSETQAKTQIWVSTFCIIVLASFWSPLWRMIAHEWFHVLELSAVTHHEDGWTREEYSYFPQVFDHLLTVFGWVLLILVGASWRLTTFCPEGTQRQLARIRAGLATLFYVGFVLSLAYRISPVVQEVNLTARASEACIEELKEIETAKRKYLQESGGPATNLNVLGDYIDVSKLERCLLPHGSRQVGDLARQASCSHAGPVRVWRHTLFEYYVSGEGHSLATSSE